MSFRTRKLMRFAHCDPAGIGFYPRYVELCNEIVEDWFGQGLGVSFRALHEEHALGIPAVRLEADFKAPCVYGEVLDYELVVADLGRTSATLVITATCEGQLRMRFRLKIVLMSLATRRPVAIDDAWRARFAPFVATATA